MFNISPFISDLYLSRTLITLWSIYYDKSDSEFRIFIPNFAAEIVKNEHHGDTRSQTKEWI